MDPNSLSPRHIQNHSEAQSLKPYWGYADRVVPCTNDAGTCEYLDSVYHGHELGMLYTGIIWATFLGILFVWGITRLVLRSARRSGQTGLESLLHKSTSSQSTSQRLQCTFGAFKRRWLLPEFARPVFGRTTRLQVLILVVLIGYLTIWTFVGIVYQRWIPPVKKHPGLFNTRSGLGPFSDRIGVIAYALIPLSVLLSSRESILSLITGIPYQHFNFIHRWLGYIILVQSAVHTIGWSVIEFRLYQPQPQVGVDFVKQLYVIWGIVAQILIIMLFLLSLRPVIKLTGYEFFRKAHYVIAMVFIGACWGHWEQLKCFLLPSLLIWLVDRAARLVRTWLLHYNPSSKGMTGFTNAQAKISRFRDDISGDVIRLDFAYTHDSWAVGQHFYLCFPELSMWQSHPFTPLSLPKRGLPAQKHAYLIRSKQGETRNLAALAARRLLVPDGRSSDLQLCTTPVVLTGPYGEKSLSSLEHNTNILCIAGGTGVTYVLPLLLHIAQQPANTDRKVEFVWAVRMESDIDWIEQELEELKTATKSHNIYIRIFITRDCCVPVEPAGDRKVEKGPQLDSESSSSSTSSNEDMQTTKRDGYVSVSKAKSQSINHTALRPNLHASVSEFVESTIRGPTVVYASGPGTMISDLRKAVASCNSVQRVWKGEERLDVDLICDNRLEW